MRLSIHNLDRNGRDIVSGLVLGYEGDARANVSMESQVERLTRWRDRGWQGMSYHYNILALLIAYAKVKRQTYTLGLPGMRDD